MICCFMLADRSSPSNAGSNLGVRDLLGCEADEGHNDQVERDKEATKRVRGNCKVAGLEPDEGWWETVTDHPSGCSGPVSSVSLF